jgi:hypothetical protein
MRGAIDERRRDMLKPSRAQRKTAQRKHAVNVLVVHQLHTTSPSDPDAAWRRLSHRFVSGSRDAASEPRRLETTYESRPSAPFHTCGNVVTRRSPVRCTQSVSYIGPDRKAQGRRGWPRNWQRCPNLGSRECQRLASPTFLLSSLKHLFSADSGNIRTPSRRTRVHANHPAIVFVIALPHFHTAPNSNASYDGQSIPILHGKQRETESPPWDSHKAQSPHLMRGARPQ